jgi:hypothetical protein
MKHYYSQNVIDLVNDYSFVGLNLFDDIFRDFKKCCTLKDFNKVFWRNQYENYIHCCIPFLATIRTMFNEDSTMQLDVKLNNSGFDYIYELPCLDKNVERHNSGEWILVKHSSVFVETYMKNIYSFFRKYLGELKLVQIYYNKKNKRCDIKAFAQDFEATFYQKICVTFEPGDPARNQIQKCYHNLSREI